MIKGESKGKRILITSTDVMMYQFLLPHVRHLYENGYTVDVACSKAEGYKNEKYHEYIREHLPEGSAFYPVPLERSPFTLKNRKGLTCLKEIISKNDYDLIWTNEPVMSVMTRLAARKARKRGTKVLYLAHGYHFFKGAPKANWLAYPVEKVMSHFCDAMCMICFEDYYFTQKHMPKKPVYHIDGIGLDVRKYADVQVDRGAKRRELGFTDEDILVLSVGELQHRKNHEPMLRALAAIGDKRIKYIICGRGELEQHLLSTAKELGMADNFFLLGHRYDIAEILKCVDIFAHPSRREGLGIAALEAMAAGLPLVTSNVQGIKDYVIDGQTGYVTEPNDVEGYKTAVLKLISDSQLRAEISKNNKEFVKKYDISNSVIQMQKIIEKILGV